MAGISGKLGAVYLVGTTPSAFTNEACTEVTSNQEYKITDAAKRYWPYETYENFLGLGNWSFETWTAGTSVAPDGWVLSGAGATIARDAVDYKHGSYGAKVVTAAADAFLTAMVPEWSKMKGRTVSFDVWVKASAIGKAKIGVDDGVNAITYSSLNAGITMERLATTHSVAANATKLEVLLFTATGTVTATWDAVRIVNSTQILRVFAGAAGNEEQVGNWTAQGVGGRIIFNPVLVGGNVVKATGGYAAATEFADFTGWTLNPTVALLPDTAIGDEDDTFVADVGTWTATAESWWLAANATTIGAISDKQIVVFYVDEGNKRRYEGRARVQGLTPSVRLKTLTALPLNFQGDGPYFYRED